MPYVGGHVDLIVYRFFVQNGDKFFETDYWTHSDHIVRENLGHGFGTITAIPETARAVRKLIYQKEWRDGGQRRRNGGE